METQLQLVEVCLRQSQVQEGMRVLQSAGSVTILASIKDTFIVAVKIAAIALLAELIKRAIKFLKELLQGLFRWICETTAQALEKMQELIKDGVKSPPRSWWRRLKQLMEVMGMLSMVTVGGVGIEETFANIDLPKVNDFIGQPLFDDRAFVFQSWLNSQRLHMWEWMTQEGRTFKGSDASCGGDGFGDGASETFESQRHTIKSVTALAVFDYLTAFDGDAPGGAPGGNRPGNNHGNVGHEFRKCLRNCAIASFGRSFAQFKNRLKDAIFPRSQHTMSAQEKEFMKCIRNCFRMYGYSWQD